MARNDIFVNINAISPADAFVTGQQDMTAADAPELILGDTPTFNFYFTDNTNTWPSWAGNAAYTVTWALSDAVSGDFAPAATTGNATPITGGWSIDLPLNAYDLVGLLNSKRISQAYPVTYLWQQIRVTAPTGKEVTRAMVYTPIRYRAISDTQNTESATPTGGRFVTVNNTNDLTTPTLAQFYDANPVPASALPLGLGTDTAPANGELLIGNGSGYVTSTLTAGTGVTITNGAGSITIDASGAQELLTATVKNAEAVPITKGQVVYLFSATGNMPSVKLASNSSDATSAKTFGVVSDTSIAANGTGTITCVGVVDGLNLGGYSDGDTVYLGATPGSITATKPYAPNHLVYVGIIERANAGNGELYVRVQNGYELDEIHDVQITSAPAAGALLMRDATNSLWKANRLSAGTNIAVTNADTSVTIGLTGTVAVANGGTGVTTSTGSGSVVLSTSPSLTTPILGTPQSGTLTNCTGLPVSTGVSGLGSNVATFLATPSSANLRSAVTDETGSGALVFANTPTLVTPDIGAATGTSATLTGNANVSDVRLGGTSGPSAKSSIAARAARQGLVGNGTAESTATLTSALGSTDKSLAVTVLVNEAGNGIFHFGTSNSTVARQLQIALLTTRKLRVELLGATTGDIRQANTDSAIAENGKFAHVVCTISGSTLTIYVNGVSVSYTEVTAGTPPAWSDTVNGTAVEFGGAAGTSFASTALETPYVYNRALSTAEVVSLYESGVPSGADYGVGINSSGSTVYAGQSMILGDNSTFTSDTGWWTKGTGVTISSGSANLPSTGAALSKIGICTPGKRYRATIVVTALSGGTLNYTDLQVTSTAIGTGPGTYVFDYTHASTATNGVFGLQASGAAATIDSVTLTPLGLLLAPDAAQAGGGLTWYDTSGNSANITLPASGVSWNVPSSLKTATGWTFGGDTRINSTAVKGTGGASPLILGSATGGANDFNLQFFRSAAGLGDSYYAFQSVEQGVSYRNITLNPNGGNVLVGTATDGGQKLQVAGTGAFGNTTSSSTTSPITVSLGGTYGPSIATGWKARVYEDSSGNIAGVGATSIGTYLGASYSNPILFVSANAEIARFSVSNNLLIGTTTDSGNGKLQLATHTTSAGGIGFGTDLSFYRVSGNTMAAKFQSGTKGLFLYADTGNAGIFDVADAGANHDAIYFNSTTKTVVIATNATTALTLDSSQNAKFAGKVTIAGAPVVSGNQRLNLSNYADGTLQGSFYGAPSTNQKFLNTGWDVNTYGSAYSGFTINGQRGVIASSTDAHTRVVTAAGNQVFFGSLSSADGWTTTNPTFSSFGTIDSSGLTVSGTIATGGSSNSAYLSINTNQSYNTAGPVTVTVPDNTGGFVTVVGWQSGVGKSSWTIPYVKHAGTIVLGTAIKSIITADPITGAAASSGNISLTLFAANTNIKWGINSTPF